MLPRLHYAAFHIPALAPDRPLPVVQIRRPDGTLIDAVRGQPSVPGPRGWDALVRRLGYRPVTRWSETDVGLGGGPAHLCKVEPLPAGVPPVAGLEPPCAASIVLSRSDAERLALHRGNGAAGESDARAGDLIVCEYAAGHRLPHIGLGQPRDHAAVSTQPWWWLLWYADDVMLTEALPCVAEGPAPDSGRAVDACSLPRGHDDASPPHSWQLADVPPARPTGGPGPRAVRRPGER